MKYLSYSKHKCIIIIDNLMYKKQIKAWAEKYETTEFILTDPIQIPHRYTNKNDIEITAFITAWLSYGNRKAFLSVLNNIDSKEFIGEPYQYILSLNWQRFKDSDTCLYRFYKWKDFYAICVHLHQIYSTSVDMENYLYKHNADTELCKSLSQAFDGVKGIPHNNSSACKRLNMFLRWMVRQNSPVDFGIWKSFNAECLIIPLDTHVFRVATELGLTKRKVADMKTAKEITNALKVVFPHDPCKGDFALYGFGVNAKSITQKTE